MKRNKIRCCKKCIVKYVLEAIIIVMNANFKEKVDFSPRIPIVPSDLPFKFKRLQFPIHHNFATGINNKSQGQSMCTVGISKLVN